MVTLSNKDQLRAEVSGPLVPRGNLTLLKGEREGGLGEGPHNQSIARRGGCDWDVKRINKLMGKRLCSGWGRVFRVYLVLALH